MVELDRKDYHKALKALHEVHINNLFARSVVENHVSGKVFVDNHDHPTTFYVIHPYGMSLLFGKHDNSKFNAAFKNHALNVGRERNTPEWMQAYPRQWDEVLKELFADCSIKSSENKDNRTSGIVELNTRVNFKFNPEKYAERKKKIRIPDTPAIRTDKEAFNRMQGSVIPSHFWNGADDFLKNSVGFSSYVNNELACTAFGSYILDNMFELGMETIPKYRGRGLAQYTCSLLIDYCLENNYEPIWACRLENTGSYRLAETLGFDDFIQIPYYRLSS